MFRVTGEHYCPIFQTRKLRFNFIESKIVIKENNLDQVNHYGPMNRPGPFPSQEHKVNASNYRGYKIEQDMEIVLQKLAIGQER